MGTFGTGGVIRMPDTAGSVWDTVGDLVDAAGQGYGAYMGAKNSGISDMLSKNFGSAPDYGQQFVDQNSSLNNVMGGTQDPFAQFGASIATPTGAAPTPSFGLSGSSQFKDPNKYRLY
jgi:hypothetical protein